MKIIIGILLLSMVLLVGCQEEDCSKEGSCLNLEANPDILYDLKYEIRIDCEFVKEYQNYTTIDSIGQTTELCKEIFPDLWNETNGVQ